GQPLNAVALDKYKRAYVVDLAANMRGARPHDRLEQALRVETRSIGIGDSDTSIAFTLNDTSELRRAGATELQLSEEDARTARVLAGRVIQRFAPDTQLGFAFAESARGLAAQMQGQDRPAFLITPDAQANDGMLRTTDLAFALRYETGARGLTFSADEGQVF